MPILRDIYHFKPKSNQVKFLSKSCKIKQNIPTAWELKRENLQFLFTTPCFFDSEFLENIFFQFSQELGLEIAKRSLISASAWKFIRSSDWLWHHPIRSQKRLSTAAAEFCYNKLKKVIKLTFSEFFIAYFLYVQLTVNRNEAICRVVIGG